MRPPPKPIIDRQSDKEAGDWLSRQFTRELYEAEKEAIKAYCQNIGKLQNSINLKGK
jgi:hypothetical protein